MTIVRKPEPPKVETAVQLEVNQDNIDDNDNDGWEYFKCFATISILSKKF